MRWSKNLWNSENYIKFSHVFGFCPCIWNDISWFLRIASPDTTTEHCVFSDASSISLATFPFLWTVNSCLASRSFIIVDRERNRTKRYNLKSRTQWRYLAIMDWFERKYNTFFYKRNEFLRIVITRLYIFRSVVRTCKYTHVSLKTSIEHINTYLGDSESYRSFISDETRTSNSRKVFSLFSPAIA